LGGHGRNAPRSSPKLLHSQLPRSIHLPEPSGNPPPEKRACASRAFVLKEVESLFERAKEFEQPRTRELMSDDYLLKTEPSEYSFENLQRDEVTVWDGVSNPVALRHLREMKPGARLVIYETADRKSAVGTAVVVSVDSSDPKNPAVKIKAGKALAKPVSLAEVKANKLFADSPLVRQGRLSVVPLTAQQYKFLTGA
jgi:predicted RNA-binding protein with PUA-like domain